MSLPSAAAIAAYWSSVPVAWTNAATIASANERVAKECV